MGPSGAIAICVLTDKIKDRSWGDDNAADLLCSHIAKEAYDYFNQERALDDGPASLAGRSRRIAGRVFAANTERPNGAIA